MSIRIMALVWEKAPYTEGTMLALLALADWANDEGICWPFVKQLAQKARLSHSGTEFCLRKLIEDGAISIVKQGTGRSGNVYQFAPKYRPLVTKAQTLSNTEGQTLSKPTPNKEEPSLNRQIQIQGMTEEEIKWAVDWNAKEKARGRV